MFIIFLIGFQVVYVARNSRDTCVSYYHHCKLLEGYKGDFEVFCKLFLNGAGTNKCFKILQFTLRSKFEYDSYLFLLLCSLFRAILGPRAGILATEAQSKYHVYHLRGDEKGSKFTYVGYT